MKIVTVIYHQEPVEDGCRTAWWAESSDAPSFFATGDSRDVVRQRVLEALPVVVGDELEYVEVDVGAPTVGVLQQTDSSAPSEQGWSYSDEGPVTA